MRILPLFFLFSVLFNADVNAKNYFTGDYSEDDLKQTETYQNDKIKKVTESKNAEVPVEQNQRENGKSDSGKLQPAAQNNKSSTGNVSDNRNLSSDNSAYSGSVSVRNNKKTEEKSSPELENLPALPLDGSVSSAEEVFYPKDNSYKKPDNTATRGAEFFMNDKDVPVADSSVPEIEKGLYISYIPNERKIYVGGLMVCTFGLKIENRTGMDLKRMRVKFLWKNPEPDPVSGENRVRTKSLLVTNLANGITDSFYSRQPGKQLCQDYSSVALPKAKIESCIMPGLSEMQCASMIKFRK